MLCLALVTAAGMPAVTLPANSLTVQVRDVRWDATRSRFFASIGPADAQWPSSVVIVNPDTAQVEDSIPVVDTPDHLAISDDGRYLYVGIDDKGVSADIISPRILRI